MIKTFKWIGIVLLGILLIIPWILIYFILRSQKLTVTLYPEFEIVNIENRKIVTSDGKEVDVKGMGDAVRAGKELLKRIGVK